MTEFDPPLQLSSIKVNHEKPPISDSLIQYNKPGVFVSIRPCKPEYKDKTYLGLYIGEIAIGLTVKREDLEGGNVELTIERTMYNPAIFVFALNKVIFGIESWWGAALNTSSRISASKGLRS